MLSMPLPADRVFRALSEPKRLRLIGALETGERSVSDMVSVLRWPQPQVSKHLGVLRQAGLVAVRRDRRKRMYRLNGEGLRAVQEWAARYQRFWQHQLDQIKARAEARARADARGGNP
jgi:DNA-binding transcriptional ArsR family regulator